MSKHRTPPGLLEGSNGNHSSVIPASAKIIPIAKDFPEWSGKFSLGPINPKGGRRPCVTCTPIPDSKAVKLHVKGAGSQDLYFYYEATPARLGEIAAEIKQWFESS